FGSPVPPVPLPVPLPVPVPVPLPPPPSGLSALLVAHALPASRVASANTTGPFLISISPFSNFERAGCTKRTAAAAGAASRVAARLPGATLSLPTRLTRVSASPGGQAGDAQRDPAREHGHRVGEVTEAGRVVGVLDGLGGALHHPSLVLGDGRGERARR